MENIARNSLIWSSWNLHRKPNTYCTHEYLGAIFQMNHILIVCVALHSYFQRIPFVTASNSYVCPNLAAAKTQPFSLNTSIFTAIARWIRRSIKILGLVLPSVPRQGQGMAEEPLEKATSGQQHPRTSSMVHQWHRRLLIHLTLVLFFHYSVLLLLDFCWNSPLTTHTSTPSQTVDSTVRGPCWQLDSAQAEDDLLPAISARGVLLSGQSS